MSVRDRDGFLYPSTSSGEEIFYPIAFLKEATVFFSLPEMFYNDYSGSQ